MAEFFAQSPEHTAEVARKLADVLKAGDIIAFKGGMGAGKTTFTRYLMEALGSDDLVSSPTYAIMNEYTGGRLPVCHVDAYRLTSPDDLETTGFFEYTEGRWVCIVEWSELVEEVLPSPTYTVTIETLSEFERKIVIDGL